MFITLAGMSIDVRLLQPAKAFLPMVVTFAGISIDVSLLQFSYLLLVDYQYYTL